jgi:hypothetical protein
VTDNSKGNSLFHYGINYSCKKFYDTGPWSLNTEWSIIRCSNRVGCGHFNKYMTCLKKTCRGQSLQLILLRRQRWRKGIKISTQGGPEVKAIDWTEAGGGGRWRRGIDEADRPHRRPGVSVFILFFFIGETAALQAWVFLPVPNLIKTFYGRNLQMFVIS